MKDLTKLKSNVYSGASVDVVNRNMINRQMFHHYRRVLSARKVVDSSPPLAYSNSRRRQQSSRQGRGRATPRRTPRLPEEEEEDVVEGGAGERCIVADMFELSCAGRRRRTCSSLDVRSPSSPAALLRQQQKKKSCNCPGRDATDGGRLGANNRTASKNADPFETSFVRPVAPFQPAILRRDAESKVRGLRVYHPPRKRSGQRKKKDAADEAEQLAEAAVTTSGESSARSTATGGEPWPSVVGVCFCGATTTKSKVSSCDSAYNGGGTSSAAESPASSPARRQISARESPFGQFVEVEVEATERKDAACQTETASDVVANAFVDRGTEPATAPHEGPRRKWSLTDLYLYPDPFDDELLLQECMQGLDLSSSSEDPYGWSDVPSLSGELFAA